MLFRIKQPRWHDKVVLLADSKLSGYNRIYFEAPSLPGEWWISGKEAKEHPLESNGVIKCRAVPLNKLNQWPGDELL